MGQEGGGGGCQVNPQRWWGTIRELFFSSSQFLAASFAVDSMSLGIRNTAFDILVYFR